MGLVVIPSVEMRGILAGLAAGCTGSGSSSSSGAACTGRLCNLTLRVWVNDFLPNLASVWADFVEATFSGYSPFTPVTWSVPITDTLGLSKLFGGCHLFVNNGGGLGNTVYGWALTREDGGTKLVAAYREDAPVPMTALAQSYNAEVYFPLLSQAG